MSSPTFRAKTAVGSFLLVSLFIGFVGIFADHILAGLNQTSASRTLQNEVQAISTTIEALTKSPPYDQIDPLPPGQLGLIISPTKEQLLNSLTQFNSAEISTLQALPINEVQKFESETGSFWVLNSIVAGPGGPWPVLVVQNNYYGALLAKRTQIFFLILGLGLIIISTLGAWILASFVLKPVREMQQHAQAMIQSEQHSALPVPRPNDELKDLAITLNELLDRLHQSLQRERRLVADVSHELRTPLSTLQTRLELLKVDYQGDPSWIEINNLEKTTKQMSVMVDNLLYMARQEMGRENQPISEVSVRTLIPHVIDNARILAAEQNIEITFEIVLKSDIEISSDALQRVLTNLISNAINASDFHGKVHVLLQEFDTNILLLVEDEGSGFPQTFIPLAFERFTRPDSSRARNTGGSGLGLALVKSILDNFDAQIYLSNREPRGARVEVLLNKHL